MASQIANSFCHIIAESTFLRLVTKINVKQLATGQIQTRHPEHDRARRFDARLSDDYSRKECILINGPIEAKFSRFCPY